jgi:hypothetical protein
LIVKLTFENVSLILGRGLLRGCDITGRKREEGASLYLAEGHIGVSHEVVELVHKVLGDQVGPANLIQRVTENWHEHLLFNKAL